MLTRRVRRDGLRRERVSLPGGDFLDLDWASPDTPTEGAPIVLILHGLEGSSRSPYARGQLDALAACGLRAGVMHFRTCSGEMNRAARTYHSGETTDIDFVTRMIKAREPDTPLLTVGYSLGGNVLLKWLSEQGPNAPVLAAVAVSVPYDLGGCADRLEQGFSRIYARHLLRSLKHKIAAKLALMPNLNVNREGLRRARTLREFDEHVTAPLHGFSGASDYYTRSSSRQYLKRIECPTLLLHAMDDPFMTPEVLPESDELSSNAHMEISERGGHVGFVSASSSRHPTWWLEHRIPHYLLEAIGRDERTAIPRTVA